MPDSHVRPPAYSAWFLGIVGPGSWVLLGRVVRPKAGPWLHRVAARLDPVDAGISCPIPGRPRRAFLRLLILEVAVVGSSAESPVGSSLLGHAH